ncbi:MAG: XRE family transcriptional regulator [Candidatus Binatia bacterium]
MTPFGAVRTGGTRNEWGLSWHSRPKLRSNGADGQAPIPPGGGNVFRDLGFPPHEAAVMLLRCELAEALRRRMERERLTQAQAAKRLGVAQPRISEIARNKVDKRSLDYLVGLCAKAGVSVAVTLAA